MVLGSGMQYTLQRLQEKVAESIRLRIQAVDMADKNI